MLIRRKRFSEFQWRAPDLASTIDHPSCSRRSPAAMVKTAMSTNRHPCATPSESSNPQPAKRRQVNVKRVDECATLHDLFTHCLRVFGGAYLRRIYTILDQAIRMGCPITLSVAGPVTVSGQHLAWMISLLETGSVTYVSTTDAVCYHGLPLSKKTPFC